jgi:hypothetical protein
LAFEGFRNILGRAFNPRAVPHIRNHLDIKTQPTFIGFAISASVAVDNLSGV